MIELIEGLQDTAQGKNLVTYLKHLKDKAYDSRTWGENGSRESAELVAKFLQVELIDKIQKKKNPQQKALDGQEYE